MNQNDKIVKKVVGEGLLSLHERQDAACRRKYSDGIGLMRNCHHIIILRMQSDYMEHKTAC